MMELNDLVLLLVVVVDIILFIITHPTPSDRHIKLESLEGFTKINFLALHF